MTCCIKVFLRSKKAIPKSRARQDSLGLSESEPETITAELGWSQRAPSEIGTENKVNGKSRPGSDLQRGTVKGRSVGSVARSTAEPLREVENEGSLGADLRAESSDGEIQGGLKTAAGAKLAEHSRDRSESPGTLLDPAEESDPRPSGEDWLRSNVWVLEEVKSWDGDGPAYGDPAVGPGLSPTVTADQPPPPPPWHSMPADPTAEAAETPATNEASDGPGHSESFRVRFEEGSDGAGDGYVTPTRGRRGKRRKGALQLRAPSRRGLAPRP